MIKKLYAEAKRLRKPTRPELWKKTGILLLEAVLASGALFGVDLAFRALVGLFL